MKQFESLCNEYRENKRLIEELTAMNEDIKAAIVAIMNGKEVVTSGACKASYKTVTQSRLDSTGIKTDHPDIYRDYMKQSSYKRFTVV